MSDPSPTMFETATNPELITLLVALFAVLVVASVVGFVLQNRLSPDGTNAVIENLNDRIRAWWVMIVAMAMALQIGRASCRESG